MQEPVAKTYYDIEGYRTEKHEYGQVFLENDLLLRWAYPIDAETGEVDRVHPWLVIIGYQSGDPGIFAFAVVGLGDFGKCTLSGPFRGQVEPSGDPVTSPDDLEVTVALIARVRSVLDKVPGFLLGNLKDRVSIRSFVMHRPVSPERWDDTRDYLATILTNAERDLIVFVE
ncbi:MAG: hypothetical protein U9Q03_02950 [Patescibacteria group bacterium]|nr:hypothetical protein [Patescibacteria group bacterium]